MGKPWSKLQKEYYLIVADGLRIQLHCTAYRESSEHGPTDVPRFWITLGKQTIWDYPRHFIDRLGPSPAQAEWYPYTTKVPDISALIREYIDTPKDELFAKEFSDDHWGLTNILKASDKRIGKRRLAALKEKVKEKAVLRVIDARLGAHTMTPEDGI